MAEGCELLLDVFGPGIVGGILIPILGALPDAMMILMSGMGDGTVDEITEEIQVGLGTLAGSTTMLLCLAFAASVWLARRQLGGPEMRALTRVKKVKRKTLNTLTGEVEVTTVTVHVPARPKEFSLTKVGATGLSTSKKSAIICILSSATYLIIQLPALVYGRDENAAAEEKTYALIGFIVSLVAFFSYLIYTYLDKDAQEIVLEKQRALAEKFAVTRGFNNMRVLLNKSGGDGLDPFHDAQHLFEIFDVDNSGAINFEEMSAGFKSLGYNFSDDDQCRAAFNTIDKNGDESITLLEFKHWIEDYLLYQYLVSLPAPAEVPLPVPQSLPATVRDTVLAVHQDDGAKELSIELPAEQRYQLHSWAAGARGMAYVVTTHCVDSEKEDTEDIRTIVLTKRSDASQVEHAIANIRPQPVPYEAGFPVWACASPLLKAFYRGHGGSPEAAFRALFDKIDVSGSGFITLNRLQEMAREFALPLTPAQLSFCFYSRDTNFDGRLAADDLEGLLCSMVDAHTAASPAMTPVSGVYVGSTGSVNEEAPLIGSAAHGYSTLEVDEEEDKDDDDEEEKGHGHDLSYSAKMRSALTHIILGTLVVAIVSDPMCEVISAIGNEAGIPAFYVSFIITPLVSNASEIISTLCTCHRCHTPHTHLTHVRTHDVICICYTF